MKDGLTLEKLLGLTDEQKTEAFERIANIYMCTTNLDELDQDITSILESYYD